MDVVAPVASDATTGGGHDPLVRVEADRAYRQSGALGQLPDRVQAVVAHPTRMKAPPTGDARPRSQPSQLSVDVEGRARRPRRRWPLLARQQLLPRLEQLHLPPPSECRTDG